MKTKWQRVIWISLVFTLILSLPAYAVIGGDGQSTEGNPVDSPDSSELSKDVTLTTEPYTNDVQKVAVSWGDQPNPGYSLTIDQIIFDHTKQIALIKYTKHYPKPDKFYAQVITEAKDITYVPAAFEVCIREME